MGEAICCHTFPTTGIINYMEHGGILVDIGEIERIQI
jgi:hypothetical protein